MSIGDLVVRGIGLILAVVGLALILAAVGLHLLAVGVSPDWLEFLVGLLCVGFGAWLVRGGAVTP